MSVLAAVVIDDFLPPEVADGVEELLSSEKITWTYSNDITFGDSCPADAPKNPGFNYTFIGPYIPNPFKLIKNIPNSQKMPFAFSSILRAVSFMQNPRALAEVNLHNNKHIDAKEPHIVLLYYVIDSDGDTFLFSNDVKDNTITQRVTPRKNRALIFDGALYHASSTPTDSKRCVINFNLRP